MLTAWNQFSLAALIFAAAVNAAPSLNLRLNQLGFLPLSPKRAAVVNDSATDFDIVDSASGQKVFSGKLGAKGTWTPSEESARLADFSEVKKPGTYRLEVPGVGASGHFRIDSAIYRDLYRDLTRYFYFNRASLALKPEYAGKWARGAGHPDDKVKVHASAATEERPEGFVLNASGGWYDAGDYNKYMGPTAVTIAELLTTYEDAPDFFKTLDLNIPESGNALPDILDETLWALRMLLRCQDPQDGGVYHKITSANFSGFVVPDKDLDARWAVQKSVTATYDFAAALAKAARVLRPFESSVPGLADSAVAAARKAWAWGEANPKQTYKQDSVNKKFNPDIVTGDYGDETVSDERFWAGIELGLTTSEDSFFVAVNPQNALTGNFSVPSWASVNAFALFSLASHVQRGGALPARISAADVQTRIVNLAKVYTGRVATSAFGVGLVPGDFFWGSNGNIAAQGMILMMAYRLTQDKAYFNAAIDWQDYLLGRNGTGFSYVTGYGWNPVMYPHHRPSGSDTIVDPVPGMLSGGPNPGRQDTTSGCVYKSKVPAKAFSDQTFCYASNEVAIYWNGPAVYLAGILAANAEGKFAGMSLKPGQHPKRGKSPRKLNRSAPTWGNPFPDHGARDALGRDSRVPIPEARPDIHF